LPGDEVPEGPDGYQLGHPPLELRRVDDEDLLEEDGHRPGIEDDVVPRPDQLVHLGGELHQLEPQERRPRQLEARVTFGGPQRLQRVTLGLAVEVPPVEDLER
jgi:hypothetical protein